MKRKNIDASREARLWIVQIIVPAIGFGTTLLTIPEVRQAVGSKFKKAKHYFKTKFGRKNKGL